MSEPSAEGRRIGWAPAREPSRTGSGVSGGLDRGEWRDRVEQEGTGAVFPRCLEAEAYATVMVEREALLGERRPRDVAAQAGRRALSLR